MLQRYNFFLIYARKIAPRGDFSGCFLFPTNYLVIPLISLIFTDLLKQKL